MNRLIALLTTVLFLSSQPSHAVEVHTLDIGAAAPDFNLPGVDGKNYSLKDFASAKILVVVFTSNHCPTAQAYEGRIKKLASDYGDKGVTLVAINPNNPDGILLSELSYTDLSDSFDEMKIRAKDHQFNFPYIYDGDEQKTAHAYGCVATPHIFIFDADRKLRYEGRIDDSDVKTVHHTDAKDAIDELLAGKPVAMEKTHVFGCSTKWIDKSTNAKKAVEEWDKEPVTLNGIDADAVKKLAANDSKNLRLINVWATWCGPCVHEMPELLTINRMYRKRGLETVTISMDDAANKDAVLKYLTDHHLAFDNHIWSSDDKDALVNALDKNWQGPVPFTLLVAPGGKVLYRQTGEFDSLELKQAIVGYLGRTYSPTAPAAVGE
jgi:peroxiredoxin